MSLDPTPIDQTISSFGSLKTHQIEEREEVESRIQVLGNSLIKEMAEIIERHREEKLPGRWVYLHRFEKRRNTKWTDHIKDMRMIKKILKDAGFRVKFTYFFDGYGSVSGWIRGRQLYVYDKG